VSNANRIVRGSRIGRPARAYIWFDTVRLRLTTSSGCGGFQRISPKKVKAQSPEVSLERLSLRAGAVETCADLQLTCV